MNSRESSLLQPMTKRGLIPFLMAGDPNHAAALRFALALIDEGAIALEIGVPFSDPVADGSVIQKAAARALSTGTTLRSSMKLVAEIKAARPESSIVLFTYLNPVLKMGLTDFVKQARAAGVDATLVVDLPPEEAADHVRIHREGKLGTVFLASPTSDPERLANLVAMSTGFIYGISRVGITGEAQTLSDSLGNEIRTLRDLSGGLPIAVGFGISTPEQAGLVAKIADAVIIGSRFISIIDESGDTAEAEFKLRDFARRCVSAIKVAQLSP